MSSVTTLLKLISAPGSRLPYMNRQLFPSEVSNLALVGVLTSVCVITRLMAIPASLWEWDEILFARALYRYDLSSHSPHPPGFPVFVFLARIAHLILRDDHRALVSVAFIFGAFLTPALFYLYDEIFKDRQIAVAGALIGSFAPSVWVYSCAGRSDGPAFVLGIIASTLVLRGLTSQRSLWIGCAVLGAGLGVRVTLLPLVAPALAIVLLMRLRRREWRVALWAVSILALCILVWFLPLVWHQTWRVYSEAVNPHRQYIWQTDSMFAANRNNIISYRLSRYFVDIWGVEWIMHTIYALAALGILALILRRRWSALGWMLVIFVPYMAFSFVLNTPMGAALYSLPYIPFFAGLAACGAIMLPRLLVNTERKPKLANIGAPIAITLAISFAGWSYPTIKMLHGQASPTLSAVRYLEKTLDPQRDLLVYDEGYWPYVHHYLSGFRTLRRTAATTPLTGITSVAGRFNLVYLTAIPSSTSGTQHFNWQSEKGAPRLGRLSLARYEHVYVVRSN
jgi:hypothetical protein